MPFFDRVPNSVGQAASSVGSAAAGAIGTFGTIAGEAGRISGAVNNLSNAAASVSALRSINLPPGGNSFGRFAQGAALFGGAVAQTTNAVSSAMGAVGSIGNAISGVGGALGSLGGVGSALGTVSGALGSIGGALSAFGVGGGSADWRARISGVGGELAFPYTPSISIQGGANYEEVAITHQNYSFFAYQNSKAESINISAPYYVEDASQAQQWLKAVSFLRTNTKMFPDGNPPFICKFNAYGNYVFKDIPVIIRSYSVELPNGVDYISAGGSHVPIKSQFTVQLQPIYSREKVKTFNLFSFVNGGSAGFI